MGIRHPETATAVQDRWIPELEHALAEVTFTIAELERADAARLRLAGRQAESC
jgi:uncharacterized coiled-coil protein SlyX